MKEFENVFAMMSWSQKSTFMLVLFGEFAFELKQCIQACASYVLVFVP